MDRYKIQIVKKVIIMTTKKIGISADHGGFELKEFLKKSLVDNGYEVTDFGNKKMSNDDDYPDYVIPMARAVSRSEVERGIAVCGSGVGACIAVNKIRGARGCLVGDSFSAHQGVEDDDMNIICLGGRIMGQSLALEIVKIFLSANFSGAERHMRRVAKVAELESEKGLD
jgi:ribose 5-phosphate isomerase B